MVSQSDKVLAGVCLLAIFIASLVLGLNDNLPTLLLVVLVLVIVLSIFTLFIRVADALFPGIFDSCADQTDLERRDAMIEGQFVGMRA